jgi:hypothetical protein
VITVALDLVGRHEPDGVREAALALAIAVFDVRQFWTANVAERDALVAEHWVVDPPPSPRCWVPATTERPAVPLYRSAHLNGQHFYAWEDGDRTEARRQGYVLDEQVACGIFPVEQEGTVPFIVSTPETVASACGSLTTTNAAGC